MPLSLLALPNPTPYDPAEDPPGSIDPLGTLHLSERLADLLLPGFTARMYRARFLTDVLRSLGGSRYSSLARSQLRSPEADRHRGG